MKKPEVDINPNSPANKLLFSMHDMIDDMFGRKDRTKKIDPVILKAKMSLLGLVRRYMQDIPPIELRMLLNTLVERGSVVTNIYDQNIHPFDAWFIPKTEIINDQEMKIYNSVKKILF